jgi:steroid 5-alpha reductase family enzyme
MTNPWLLLPIGWGIMAVVMVLIWWLQVRMGDAGIVDVAWTFGVAGLSVFFAIFADGDEGRRLLVGGLAGLWGLRLALHLIKRLRKLPEDGRYGTLRRQWGARAQFNLFIFFQVQAFWSVLFAFPMFIAARNPRAFPDVIDLVGIAIWIAALAGEAVADRQLTRFRLDPGNRGKVCRLGLWRYSRHPNYFFEWVHWWAYVCLGIAGPLGWLTLLGPAVMLFFLLKITGIPPTEAQALMSRGDAYREYQRTTSVFFPWPPKKSEIA